jgi:CRP/FNR family transcriptional regulator, cyclic AMP receptor protein
MSDPALLQALRGSRLAAELSEAQVATLADLLAFRDLRAGEVLVDQGVSDNHLYVIVSGALAVTRGGAEPMQLFSLGPGDLVGELSFIDATPHYAALIAIGPTRVFGLEREKLESLLGGHADIVYRVMRAIIRTVHELQRRLSMHTVELTNYIYKQHGRY